MDVMTAPQQRATKQHHATVLSHLSQLVIVHAKRLQLHILFERWADEPAVLRADVVLVEEQCREHSVLCYQWHQPIDTVHDPAVVVAPRAIRVMICMVCPWTVCLSPQLIVQIQRLDPLPAQRSAGLRLLAVSIMVNSVIDRIIEHLGRIDTGCQAVGVLTKYIRQLVYF